MDMIVEMLPLSSKLQRADNPLRIVLDRTVGEWLDNFEQPFEQLFLMSATGGWLDAHGRDYGVPRRLDEDDEHYRQRIIYEKLDHLTPSLLSDVYNVRLFSYRGDFNVSDNTLVSDNQHIVQSNTFLGLSDEDTISILDKKFILDRVVTWVNDLGSLDYIFDMRDINIISDYSKVYELNNLRLFFNKGNFKTVKLYLPNGTDCHEMFLNCNLVNINLNLPNATNCISMFYTCPNLVNVNLNLPNVINCFTMFWGCSSLENINLSLPKATVCSGLFVSCSNLTNVDLNLPNATDCDNMFTHCSNLEDIDLDLPRVMNCSSMFWDCPNLINVKLNCPKLSDYSDMFEYAENIETIDVTIPTNKVSGFKSYVTGLNLTNLTSFIINGEEQL